MDGERFDQLARLLGRGVDRRTLSSLLLGMVPTMFAVSRDDAALGKKSGKKGGRKKGGKKKKGKKKKRRNNDQNNGNPGNNDDGGGSSTATRLLQCTEEGRSPNWPACAGCTRCNNGDCCSTAGECSVGCEDLCRQADADDDYVRLHEFLIGQGFELELDPDDLQVAARELWRGGAHVKSVLIRSRYHIGSGATSDWANLLFVVRSNGTRRALAVKRTGAEPVTVYTVSAGNQIVETTVPDGDSRDTDGDACEAWCTCEDGFDFINYGALIAGSQPEDLAEFYADAVARGWHLSKSINETRTCEEICTPASPCGKPNDECDEAHPCCAPFECTSGFCERPQEPTCSESGAPCGLGMLPCCLTLSCDEGVCEGFGCGRAGQSCGSGFDPCCATFECVNGICQECRRELQSCGAGLGSCCATYDCISGICQ